MLILRTVCGLALVLLPTLAIAQTAQVDAPPQQGLVLWLDAQHSTAVQLADGRDVHIWRDRSPAGNDASSTSAPAPPTFDSAAMNGRPALRFSGTSWLDTRPLADGPGQVTLFVVFARPPELASEGKWQRIVSCWDGQSQGDNKSPSFEISTREGSAIEPTIFTEQLSGRHRGALRVGAGRQHGSNQLHGLIGEVLVYDRGFLVDEQIQEVKAYLRAKWNIPKDPDASWTRIGQLPDPPERTTDRLPLSDQQNAGQWTPFMPLWDEFSGDRLDRSKWWDHNPTWYGRAPARFLGEGQNVHVTDDMLHLVMKYDPSLPEVRFYKNGELYKDYSSASVKAKTLVRYGYFEICARAMNSGGSSAFWFSSRVRDKRSGKPYRSEIDVFEIGGKAPGHEHAYHMNAHIFETPADGARHWSKGGTWEAPFRLADDFHVYGLQWTPDQLVYYVDGVPVRRMPNTHWKAPQHLIFDSETMGSWLGMPRHEDLPSTFSIQYVRAWKNPRTDIPWNDEFEAYAEGEPASAITRYVRSMDAPIRNGTDVSAEITVSTDFPGGSGTVSLMDANRSLIRLDPTDHPGRGWRCWWYVRIDGITPGEPITLDVGNAPWATPDRATFSTDGGRSWQHSAPGVRDGKRIRYTLQFDTPTALVAWGPPFVPADAERLVGQIAEQSPHAEAFTLCRTREDRETPALRVAAATDAQGAAKRPLIWIQARQHAWESGSSWVARGFAEWLVSEDPEAERLRTSCEIVVVPIMDIDNVHRGAGGKNQQPQDHNRDWTDTPHWRAVAAAQKHLRAAVEAGRLAAFIDLHNPSANDRSPYFYVSADELLSEEARANLDRFLATAKAEMTGPLAFQGKTIPSGKAYDPKAWKAISKNWVSSLGTSAPCVTLEVSWNTPESTTAGYLAVGRQLGLTLARYVQIPFAPPQDIARGSVSGITSLVAGDLDGDHRADVVAIEGGKHAEGRFVFAWFEAPDTPGDDWTRHDFEIAIPLRPFLGAASLADMDNDGDLDLVVSSDMHSGPQKSADVIMFRNPRPAAQATGTWHATRINQNTLAVHHINDMQIADMDGDDKPDIVCRSLEPNQIHIFFQNDSTSFDHRTIDTGLERSEGLAVGCLDEGTLPDIAFTGYWLQAPPDPRREPYTGRSIDAAYARVNQNSKEAIGDLDGDGQHDVVIGPAEAYRGGKNHVLAWYRNPASDYQQPWPRQVITASTNNNHTVQLGDVDGDGDLDLVTGIPWSGKGVDKSVLLYRNTGNGHFAAPQTIVRGKGLYTGVLADVDADGDLDIIGQDTYSGESRPWLYRNLMSPGLPDH